MTHLFVDLDGVLVDFERGYEMLYGHHPHKVEEFKMWLTIKNNIDHWTQLPAMPGALQLWAFVARWNPTILTGCPSQGYANAAEGKRKWCVRELGSDVNVITTYSRYKPKHMKAPGDILIDDMQKNIDRWNEAGGRGVLHLTAERTISILREMDLTGCGETS